MILVVDDNADLREMMCLALGHGGHPAAGASNGQEALAWLHGATAPKAILLDLTMPVMNGHQFLKAISGDPLLVKVPVIVMSAVEGCSLLALGHQVFEWLPKPFSTVTLLEVIERAARIVTS
jgi:CheY-like chemotaxis protein